MPLKWSPGSRRALVLYVGAVIGPTLAVLTLGMVSALRQMEALESLRVTTRRLQEARIASEVERAVSARAGAALADPALDRLAEALDAGDTAAMDHAHRGLMSLRLGHPEIASVFLARNDELVYPPIAPPLPHTVDEWLQPQPASARRAFEASWSRAEELERAHDAAAAANEYAAAARAPVAAALRGVALGAEARCRGTAGDSNGAAAAYQRLADEFGEARNVAGRPNLVTAALGLAALGRSSDPRLRRARDELLAGRWPLSRQQLEYLATQLGAPPGSTQITAQLAALTLAEAVAPEFRPRTTTAAGQVSMTTIGDSTHPIPLAYRRASAGALAGVVLDVGWIQGTILPAVAASVTPSAHVRIGAFDAEHAAFKTLFPGWRVAIEPTTDRPGWFRLDFAAFAATTLVVLGVLVMGVLLLARDVRRETTLNQLRADLVSGVSHELKAPLSAIRVFAEAIEDDAGVEAANRERFAGAIVQETERLRRLIDGVIDFSRIAQGLRRYALARGSLAAAVQRTADRFADYLAVNGFTLGLSIEPGLPDVAFDEMALDQAVLNLLDNAFKYSNDATHIGLAVRQRQGEVVIEVTDGGLGVSPADQTRIFERFERGAHRDRGGYGLGLYLVKHIMDAHGGRIDVESAPGRGSCFRLAFPCPPAEAQAVAEHARSVPSPTAEPALESPHAQGADGRG